jgi:hypothetical protein
MANTMDPVSGDQQQNTDSTPDKIDMEALAAKIVELLLRELEIETERAGKLFQSR